ncbi:aa3 type cytochrome c oxidase subunit IV [Tepidamorphus gemmatus]|jgi:Mg/Co/Ni transporter MgtE|uniref:Aa3 type cytochrome c oxidase subunit IV n=1 Tax=Tepidamorphus gemmatus TaxID=747076 RepID=A0A4R3MLJ8_9HYPH|nr:aa3-type cytochrome c oxidase subunit IV [Tepidamorphus gemmatus]TCT13310.1 aa3 type cytochrome c oxidase subunit IV [Tepidamorphus gemmatus]
MASQTESSMDYEAHRETYAGFVHLTVLGTAFCAVVVIMLAIGGVGGSWGLAALGIVLAIIATAVGAMANGSVIPLVATTLLILVLKLLLG